MDPLALLYGLTIVAAQTCLSYSGSMGGDMTKCTSSNNCTAFNYCLRLSNATPTTCATTSTTCSGTACSAGSAIQNPQTCSKCTDSCYLQTTASACNAMASCGWSSYCFDVSAPTPAYPCQETTQSACTSDAAGCVWFSVSETVCGTTVQQPVCALCNSTMVMAMLGPLSRMVGQTCTYPAATGFSMGASVTLNSFGMSAVGTGSCVAIPAGSGATADQATVAASLAAQMIIGAGTMGTCVKASGSMLSPSLAILGLVAFLTRF